MTDAGMPLAGGYLNRLSPNATKEEQTKALNDIIDRLNDQLKSQVFSDASNKRMIIGYQKDGWGVGKDFGIKISIPGVDVNQATDAQILFKMDLSTWFYYTEQDHKNFMQIGKLPDGTYGWAVADVGHDVSEGF